MDHVNNAVYLDHLEEALLAAGPRAGDASRRCRARSGSSTSRRRRRRHAWHGSVWADPPPAGPGARREAGRGGWPTRPVRTSPGAGSR